MQLCSCSRWSEVGGDLAEEEKLLPLAWRGVGGGNGGGNGGGVGYSWRRRKEEETEEEENLQREREDLAVAAPISGEDLSSWGGLEVVCWWRIKVIVGSSTAEDAVEREGRKRNCRNGAKRLVFGRIWTRFSPPSEVYYRKWKREIFSTLGKNFSP